MTRDITDITFQQDDSVQTAILIPHHRWLTLIMTIVTAPPPVHLETRGCWTLFTSQHPSQLSQTHTWPPPLSSEGRLCSVLDNICQGLKCWQSVHIEHEREATIVSKAWLGDAWLTLGPICLHLPLLRKPLRSPHSALLSPGSRQHLPRVNTPSPRLVSPLGCCWGLQSSPAYLTSEQDCQFLMDNDPNNDLDLWRTQIFITMQCLPRILDYDILKSGIFCLWEKSFREQRWGKKCPLIIWNSSSHRFIKHSGVAIMLCCVSSIICQQTVFGYEPLSLSTHHTLLIIPLGLGSSL